MAIKIIKDKAPKKRKPIKKTVNKKAKNGYTTRHTDLAMTYGSISIGRGRKKSLSKKIFKKIFKLLFVGCLAFASFFAYNHLMSYLCTLDRFFIDSIEITGCNNVTESEIKKLIPFEVGDSSFAVRLGQAEKEMKEYKSELKDISMSRHNWGKKIVVSLTERVPEVFVSIDDKNFGLDFDNKPFSLRGNMFDMKIPTLKFADIEQRTFLLNFYKKIKKYVPNLVPEITEIKYGEIDDIVLTLNNRTAVYWGLPKENKNKEKTDKLQQILSDLSKKNKEAKNIDLSFIDDDKNRVIVKLFVEQEGV